VQAGGVAAFAKSKSSLGGELSRGRKGKWWKGVRSGAIESKWKKLELWVSPLPARKKDKGDTRKMRADPRDVYRQVLAPFLK